MKRLIPFISLCITVIVCTNCSSTVDRIRQIGKLPELHEVQPPTQKAEYKPIKWEEDPTNVATAPSSNSNPLWQAGARSFFHDQRARRVGDIVKVIIKVDDKAELSNETSHSRNNRDNMSAPKLFGVEAKIPSILANADPAKLIDITGANNSKGTGSINRNETIQTQVAAMVTQILPNGNLVLSGNQQIRINYELRELSIQGIVRQEDISSDNSINADQIAEARISYGGRGHISNVQQPRIGTQIIDALSPF